MHSCGGVISPKNFSWDVIQTLGSIVLSTSNDLYVRLLLYLHTQVIFEGITGTSYTGDIAIDDVEILDGACPLPGMRTNQFVFIYALEMAFPQTQRYLDTVTVTKKEHYGMTLCSNSFNLLCFSSCQPVPHRVENFCSLATSTKTIVNREKLLDLVEVRKLVVMD